MIETICYLTIFIVEIMTSILFFETKFNRKLSFNLVILFSICAFIISFAVNMLSIFVVNVVVFFTVNYIILFFCYESKIQSCVFNISLLIVYMIVTELIVLYSSSLIFNSQILPEHNDSIVLIIQTAISKLLYFLLVYITAKLSKKEHRSEQTAFSLFLSILPISLVFFMVTTAYICLYYDIEKNLKVILVISDILMLVSNIIVFYIHEHTLNTNRKYTLMLLEKQNTENNKEYYKLLGEQNEISQILIHDIKKHLNAIRNISYETTSSEKINEYIDEMIGEFDKSKRVDYCNNTLLNLITYRYAQLSEQKGIDLQINIREAVLNFLSDYDITSLFDNLLENAIEAAEISEGKYIDFSIYLRNENFMIIKVSNSFLMKPKMIDGLLTSSKKSGKYHGIGVSSIKRTVSKHNGTINIDINDKIKIFCITIVFKIKKE